MKVCVQGLFNKRRAAEGGEVLRAVVVLKPAKNNERKKGSGAVRALEAANKPERTSRSQTSRYLEKLLFK